MQMIRLLEYVDKKQSNKGTLNIFDIDDTLFRSQSRVLVKKDGKIVKQLETHEYNTYKLKQGETYDFSQFRSSKMFNKTAQPIDKMINRAQRAVFKQNKEDKTIIITARSNFDDKNLFLQTFREHGFPIDNVYVERAGNIANKVKNIRASTTKAIVLKRYLKTGKYDMVRVWDDSIENLIVLNDLVRAYPNIKYQGFLVNPENGDTRKV